MSAANISLDDRAPTVDEYLDLIRLVGWRPRDRPAVETALKNSLYAVCAKMDHEVVGCGRVIGDGALHLYLTDVIVRPEWQGRGIGGHIVAALTRFVDAVPYRNTLVAVFPTAGLQRFYERYGFKTLGPESPAMQRWVNGCRD